MTQIIVDEALLREPNLWVPGKIPVGDVKIDWGNPLARGLVHCILPVDRNGVPELLDIADKDFKLASQDSTYAKQTFAADERGNRILYGVYTGSSTTTGYYQATSQKVLGLTSASIHTRIEQLPSISSLAVIFGAAGGATSCNGLRMYAYTTTLGFQVSSDPYFSTDVTYDYAYTSWRSVCGIWYGGNTQKVLSNGVSLSVNTVVDNDSATSIYNASSKTRVLTDGAYKNNIKISHIFVYGRALSDDEAAALDIDPYQFLIPA